MIKSNSVCIAYETVEDNNGSLPLLVPMSEVAGRMATQEGAKYLEKPMGGRGILLGGVSGVEPANVLIIGGGISGTEAAKMAVGLQANVTILDTSEKRLNELNKYVDFFVVCESLYDHKGNKKNINFKLKNLDFKNKVRHIVLKDPFPQSLNLWERQAFQREYLFNGIKDSDEDDYIMFSDPDEIPRPEVLKNFILKKKYAIFLQQCFNYKFNLLNINETPWSGTRLTKKKYFFLIDEVYFLNDFFALETNFQEQ